MQEYFVYFAFSKPKNWEKRFVARRRRFVQSSLPQKSKSLTARTVRRNHPIFAYAIALSLRVMLLFLRAALFL